MSAANKVLESDREKRGAFFVPSALRRRLSTTVRYHRKRMCYTPHEFLSQEVI
jgi:hypothetical protein